MKMSQDLMVSIRRRSQGLTMAEVRPCIIAMATRAESMMGRSVLGAPLELLDRPPVDFRPSDANILMASRTSICLSCIPLTTRNRGSNHRSVASMPRLMPRSSMLWQCFMRSSLSLAMPSAEQRAIQMASLAAARSMLEIREPASAELTMGLPLVRL